MDRDGLVASLNQTTLGQESSSLTIDDILAMRRQITEAPAIAVAIEQFQHIRWYADEGCIERGDLFILEERHDGLSRPAVLILNSDLVHDYPELVAGKHHIRDCPVCFDFGPYRDLRL